jgi:1,2-diacylglycerol 3-beta-galactosyltransferase
MTRVLIVFNDAGGGHRRLSEAIQTALRRRCGASAQVEIVDLFALDRRALAWRLSRCYAPAIRYAPWLYGWLYHLTDRPRLVEVVIGRSQRRLLAPVRALLRHYQPHVVVSTHPLCNRLVLDALDAERGAAPLLAAVSELVSVHASWVEPRIAAYAVATAAARDAVLARGAPPDRVRITGLPVGARFGAVAESPEALRLALGLKPDPFTLLVVGGGEGAGQLLPALRVVERLGLPLQVIAVCGRNARLRARMERLRPSFPLRVFGYVDDIPELMHAADAVLTKGGPQTIAEALVAGRPVLVSHVLPGQEEGNEHFVAEHQVGVHVPTARRLAAALERLITDRAYAERLRDNARRLARPGAADAVAAWIGALAGAAEARP